MLDDRALIVIRRRSYPEILDLALLLFRLRARSIGLAALAGIAPFAVLDAWLLESDILPRSAWFGLVFLEIPFATAPLSLVLSDALFRIRIRPAAIARRLASGLPGLIVWSLIVRPLLWISVVGIPFALARMPYTVEVVLLERVPFSRFWRRTAVLARGAEGSMMLRQLAAVVLGLVFVRCFMFGIGSLAAVFVGEDVSWSRDLEPGLWRSLLVQSSVWIAVGFFGLARFLIYIDRRIRLEGWDLELRLRAVARKIERQIE